MGIKKLYWERIRKYLKIIGGTIFLISAIIGIAAKWDFVSTCLSAIGNLFKSISNPFANPIVRDVFLFALVVGLLIWLILINRKVKNIPKVEKSELKEEWPFEWDLRYDYILERIVEADREVAIGSLLEGYRENFPKDSEKEYKLIVYDLEESNLIRSTGYAGKDKLYVRTDDGRRHYMKGIRRRYKKKEEGLKLTNEHMYVLGYIADAPTSIGQTALFEPYKKKFPNSFIIDLKAIIRDLEKMDFICRSGSEGGEFFYKATDEGVKLIRKILEKGRNKEKSSKNK